MSLYSNSIKVQIDLIEEAMKNAGVWSNTVPSWIRNFQQDQIPNIWQWLQFVYLPARLSDTLSEPHYIAPLVSPFLNAEPKYRDILQLVIELDSISTTIYKI